MAIDKNTFIRIIDVFKIEPFIFIQNRQKISTRASKAFSLIFYVITMWVCYFEIYKRVQEKEYTFNNHVLKRDSDNIFFINKESIMLAFKIENKELNTYFFNYFNF